MERRLLSSVALVLLLGGAAGAKTVVKKSPDGKVERRYDVDASGRRDGTFIEYDAQGKVALRAHYTAGKLDGVLTQYEKGRPVLTQKLAKGRLVFARTLTQMRQELTRLTAAPREKDPVAQERALALRRLQVYRYLVGVPYANLVVDDQLSRAAVAASRVCALLGRLDHHPTNPGLPEAEYKLALEGASHSNLGQGFATLPAAVDSWINDSDTGNIDRLGHRRWCLNPPLRKVGFGKVGRYTAMWAFDKSQKNVPNFDFISFPAAGLMPVEYMPTNTAWCVSLNPQKYRPPTDAVRAGIFAVDKLLHKRGEALELTYHHINNQPFGLPGCVIFRPASGAIVPDKLYLVEIEGLRRKNGQRALLRYLVQFVSLK